MHGTARQFQSNHAAGSAGADSLTGRPEMIARAVVEQAVALTFGVSAPELRAPTRCKAPVAFARQVAMYLTHVVCGLSLTDVGTLFGRDRTTVAYACGLVEDRRDDPGFDRSLEQLELAIAILMKACLIPDVTADHD